MWWSTSPSASAYPCSAPSALLCARNTRDASGPSSASSLGSSSHHQRACRLGASTTQPGIGDGAKTPCTRKRSVSRRIPPTGEAFPPTMSHSMQRAPVSMTPSRAHRSSGGPALFRCRRATFLARVSLGLLPPPAKQGEGRGGGPSDRDCPPLPPPSPCEAGGGPGRGSLRPRLPCGGRGCPPSRSADRSLP